MRREAIANNDPSTRVNSATLTSELASVVNVIEREHVNLLLTDLLPYFGNRIEISEHDLPRDYTVETLEKVAAPPCRSWLD